MEGEGYRRPPLCLFCECPVVDGGVRLRKSHAERLSKWTKAHCDTDNAQMSCLVCHFCVWDLRLADPHSGSEKSKHGINSNGFHSNFHYYADDLMRPCSVKITPLANADKFLETVVQRQVQQCPQDNLKRADAVTKSSIYVKTEEGEKTRHIPEIHLQNKFQCIYCSATYTRRGKLNEHIQLHHKDVALHENGRNNLILCPICKEMFSSQEIRAHICQHKLNEKIIKCDIKKSRPSLFKTLEGIPCVYCDKFFAKYVYMHHHVQKWHKDIAIKCNLHDNCANYFKTFEDRDNHFRKENQTEEKIREPVQCLYCDRIFSTKNTLSLHVESKHSGIALKCQYPQYGTSLKSQEDLETHFSLKSKQGKTSVDTETLKCVLCQEEFCSKSDIEKHIMIKHSKQKVCPHCQKPTSDKTDHVISGFCKVCNQKFQCLGLLKSHAQKCSAIFPCPVCSESFKMQCQLNYHCKINHTVPILQWKGLEFKSRGFKCDECLIYFSRISSQQRHNKLCNSPKVTCDTCKKQFSKTYLPDHIKRYHLVEKKLYPCPVCDWKFVRACNLRRHFERKHSKQIRFSPCEICNAMMKSTGLKRHMKLFH